MRPARASAEPARAGADAILNVGLTTWATCGGVVLAAIFLTNWPSYQYVVLGGVVPLYYYALPILVAMPIVFAQPRSIERLLREPLFWWFVAYVAAGAVWLLLAQDFIEEAGGQWRLRVLAFVLFVTVSIVASESRRAPLGIAVVVAVLIAGAFNWWDFLRPHLFVPAGLEESNPGRGAGMFINSNAAAAFVNAATIAALAFVPIALRTPLLLFPLLGVAPTLSRSGLLIAGLIIVLAMILKLVKRAQIVAIAAAMGVLAAGASFYYDDILAASDEANPDRVVQRLSWFQDMQGDRSVDDRIYPALRAWEMFLDTPITGKGTGVTSRPALGDGTHNMYLMLMAEHGFTGLALYLSLLGAVAMRGWKLTREAVLGQDRDLGRALMLYSVFLASYGCFSHNVLEEPHGLFLLAFLLGMARTARVPDGVAPPLIHHAGGRAGAAPRWRHGGGA